MKSRFKWYISPTEKEIEHAWKNGILTVDANVLLDLYRYHSKTKEDIIKSIKFFEDRVWLSDQASQEFIRNRKNVISSSGKVFSDSVKNLEDAAKSLSQVVISLKNQRLIPRKIIDDIEAEIPKCIDKAKVEIEKAMGSHPNYFDSDPIFDEILAIFDGRIGPSTPTEKLSELKSEAERRRKERIPPGYMDDSKDGDRPNGDFLLWRQSLEAARERKLPLIFVTSEQKDDWWEKFSGKRVGPRPELLREAFEFTGERIYIYQTEYFLELFAKRSGDKLQKGTVDDVRELNTSRFKRSNLGNAVQVEQIELESDELRSTGLLSIELIRPVFSFTGSGKFIPYLVGTPNISVSLIACPGEGSDLKIWAGTGTNFDFNVHVKSKNIGVHLPIGVYLFEYSAICAVDAGPEKATELSGITGFRM
jgi:hypothetical protein